MALPTGERVQWERDIADGRLTVAGLLEVAKQLRKFCKRYGADVSQVVVGVSAGDDQRDGAWLRFTTYLDIFRKEYSDE